VRIPRLFKKNTTLEARTSLIKTKNATKKAKKVEENLRNRKRAGKAWKIRIKHRLKKSCLDKGKRTH